MIPICTRSITAEHFHIPSHATIYEVLVEHWREAEALDFITLTQVLKDRNLLDQVGGPAFVTSLFTFVPTAANVELYIDIVCEKYTRRQIIVHAQQMSARAYEDGDQTHLAETIESAKVNLQKIESGNAGRQDYYGDILDSRRFDVSNEPDRPEPVLSLNTFDILTPGNIANIQAQPKAGKTAAIGAIIASTIKGDGDTLGFSARNDKGFAVIHFDTEQSPFDHFNLIKRAMRRINVESVPKWLRSYCLTDVPVNVRRQTLVIELERASQQCGGVLVVIIDGVADLCMSPNDESESLALVDQLHQLAIRFNCGILTVLHENPGAFNDSGKTRGHLGSQLERKAETNLRLKKNDDGTTVIFSTRARHANIAEHQGPGFAWSDEHQMHVSTESVSAIKMNSKRERLKELAAEIFKDVLSIDGLSWSEVHEKIQAIEDIGKSGARKKFDSMRNLSIITKRGDKYSFGN